MTQITINWHYVGWAMLLLMLFFSVAVSAFLILLYFAGKGNPAAKKVVAAVEADAVKIAASSLGKEAEQLALKAAQAALAELKAAPPVNVPNHPAITAVADLVQESAATKQVLSNVQGVLAQAQAVAAKPAA